jgi:hypothetical protein
VARYILQRRAASDPARWNLDALLARHLTDARGRLTWAQRRARKSEIRRGAAA